MPLRPPEFVVDPNDPFKNDTLGRERPIKTLAEIIAEAELGTVDDAVRILEIGEDLRFQMSPRHLPLRGIANRVDLLA